ncbi:MAG: hypothetical protein ABIZ80_17985 [Bryobacteraceae bacterium]
MQSIGFHAQYCYSNSSSGITVPIELGYSSKKVSLSAKIDTGAEFCLFERGYGEALGIDIEAGKRMELGTLSGSLIAFGHEVSLRVLEFDFSLVAYFPMDAHIRRSLLGRQGWLLGVRLGLVDYEQLIYLSRYDD